MGQIKMSESVDFLWDEDDPRLNVNNTFVLTNLPIITPDKETKFSLLLRRIAEPHQISSLYFPYTEEKKSKGYSFIFVYTFSYFSIFFVRYAFLTFPDPTTATKAFSQLEQKEVAKKKYEAIKLSDFLEIRDLPEEYTPPTIHPYIETVCDCFTPSVSSFLILI